ncbi:MAG: helix-turn-helix transcriptional regulator [Clostridia bacterium]|nr:helix-turn-helix transcriptional regulator [Clostridia bacterium]
MESKNTDELRQALLDASDLDKFLKENDEQFSRQDVTELLNEIFDKRDINKSNLAKRAGMSNVYLHQVFSGRRNASRNRMLCICLGLEATLDETQELLKRSGMGLLYPKDRRDAIIIYGLLHHQTLFEVNDKLFCENEDTLC